MKVCVASSAAPKPENFKKFVDTVCSEQTPGKLEIKGLTLMEGSGCYNYGIIVEGDDAENWVNQFTMAMMPAKWNKVHEDDPGVRQGQFEDLRS